MPNSSKTFSLFSGWDTKKEDDESTRTILNERVLSQRHLETDQVEVVLGSTTEEENKEGEQEEEDDDDDKWEKLEPVQEEKGFWNGMASWIGGATSGTAGTIAGAVSSATIVPSAGGGGSGGGGADMDSLVQTARDFVKAGETAKVKPDVTVEDFRRELEPVIKQLENKFKDLPMDKFDPASFMYYLEAEDAKKNPSWKRRKHRFCPGFDLSTINELHECLYLAELAYVDSVEDIQEGLAKFQRQSKAQYELVFASAEGEPRRPAHFLALKKETPEAASTTTSGGFPWSSKSPPPLEVTLVVRGTKEIADMLSDAMLEATPYRDGLAHDGIAQSGKWLVEKHLPLLNHLLTKANRTTLHLTLIGHSLGAGAAAIACMEFNDQPNIEATCIAFESPALVDKESSMKWKDKITTIIADADCIPRMSGATLYNLMLNVLEHDYKDRALEDVESLLNVVAQKVPLLLTQDKLKEAMEWVQTKLNDGVKPLANLTRHEIELYPPGQCYHLYRDGVSYCFVEVSCDFFNEIDVAMTMVDDHYIHTGCHAMFLDLMRRHLKQSKFDFPNDLMALRQEKPEKVEAEDGSEGGDTADEPKKEE